MNDKMCQRHPTYRHRSCTECWKLYGHMEGADFVFSGVCPLHGQRKERCSKCGKGKKPLLCPWHGKRMDRCKPCKALVAQVDADNAAARKKALDTTL